MGGLVDRFSRCFKGWRTGHPKLTLQFPPVTFLEAIQTRRRCSRAGVDVAVERFIALAHLLPLTHREAVAVAAGDQLLRAELLDELGVDLGQMDEPGREHRGQSVLADGVHVGNFVETKNARIGMGSKANHLTYLGDAVIGTGTNIGAGTITCNYDGVNKSTTTIGDRVFVGSNSSLVAPVTLADGATIGAGSVISKNAPADKLTVARARQMTVEGWQRPMKK